MKFLEKFYSTYLNYKRSHLDVLMSVKFNNLNYYLPPGFSPGGRL